MSLEELASELLILTEDEEIACSKEKANSIAGLLQERIDFVPEVLSKGRYFFFKPESYDQKIVRKKWKETAQKVLPQLANELAEKEFTKSSEFLQCFDSILERNDTHAGAVMQILRIAITGEAGGPDLMEIMSILGTQEIIDRINVATDIFDQMISNAEKE